MAGWHPPPLPIRWTAADRPAIVGRDRDLAQLRSAWELAELGLRQVVFVGGEPGVGKSRLVAETATALHGRQAVVLLGTCISAMGPAYQPFVEPLLGLIPAIERGDIGSNANAPELDEQLLRLRTLTGADSAPAGREQQFTRQLFQAATQAIQAAAAAHPMVLVLEDLHWAGDTALQLLRYLVEQTTDARLLILTTQRTTAPDRSAELVSTVGALYRLDGVSRIDLAGLATEDIATYLVQEVRVSERMARGPATILRDQTGGNPFLLGELLRELSARGGLAALNTEDLRAPESVLDTVRHRLAGLPARHRIVVQTAAVIGEEFSVAVLAAATGHRTSSDDVNSPTEVDADQSAALTYAGLEAATAIGLLEPVRGLLDVFRFPHGLARAAILELMTPYQVSFRNLCVARVLEDQFPAADLRIQRLAHHYANAQGLGYADRAMSYLAQAAGLAETGLAHQEAARLFERSADLAGQPDQRDELRLQAARNLMRASKFSRARELDRRVAAEATGTRRLRAAIGFEAASWRSGQPGEPAVTLLGTALGGVELDHRDPLYIRAIASLGRANAFTINAARSRALGAEAQLLARASADDRLLATVIQIGLQGTITPANLAEKLARANELTQLSVRVGDLRHLGPAGYYRAVIGYIRGDPAGLADGIDDVARTARATGQPFWEWVESCLSFGTAFLAADFQLAGQLIARAEGLGRSFGPGNETEGPVGLQTFMTRRETGRLEQVRKLISGQEETATNWVPGLLALYRELDLREPGRRTARYLLDTELSRHRASASWPAVLAFLCEAAEWLVDREMAEQLRPLIAEYAGMNLVGGELSATFGSADRYLGGIDSLLGKWSADEHYEAALVMDTKMGSPIHLAATLAGYSAHCRHLNHDPERSARMGAEAESICRRFGLVRISGLLPNQESRSHRGVRPAGLTAREVEVLGLLGDGLSNRGIAERLVISENTAANHVRSILLKTGAANRTQAAMYAAAHGLLG